MATEQAQRVREILERVSRVIEASSSGLSAREVRVRARVSRRTGDEALELLLRGRHLERQWDGGEWRYTSALEYRAADFAPRASFARSHAAAAGGER
jgi:hypothetical protein